MTVSTGAIIGRLNILIGLNRGDLSGPAYVFCNPLIHFTTVNSHGYFVRNGKCVDLHVSQIPYLDEGKTKVEKIVRTSKVMD